MISTLPEVFQLSLIENEFQIHSIPVKACTVLESFLSIQGGLQ